MKNFMLFLHEAADSNSQLSPEDMGALVKAHMEWSDKLASSGHLIAGDGIHVGGVQIVGKDGHLNESPVVCAGTIIGGYYIIRAQD